MAGIIHKLTPEEKEAVDGIDISDLREPTAEDIAVGDKTFAAFIMWDEGESVPELSEAAWKLLEAEWRRLGRTLTSDEAKAIIGMIPAQECQLGT